MPIAYLNFWQQDRSNSWSQDSRTHIRVSGAEAAAMVPEIRRAITAIDPDVPVSEVQVLGRQLDVQFAAVRGAGTMLVVFGGLALVLSAIGLYAALAFAIGQRTREIAVRMALGASRLGVGRLVFRRGSGIFAIGAVTGLAACLFAGPLLRAPALRREPARSGRAAHRSARARPRRRARDLAARAPRDEVGSCCRAARRVAAEGGGGFRTACGSPRFREVSLEERRSHCRLKQSAAADAHPPAACPRQLRRSISCSCGPPQTRQFPTQFLHNSICG